MLLFCWKPDGTPQRWKLQLTRELFETFLLWKSSLKTWLTQSSNLKTAVSLSLDLFNFLYCTVCKIQIFSRIYFCNPRLCFVRKKKMKELLETNGEKCAEDIQCFFWRGIFAAGLQWECSELFALAPIAFILLFPCHCTHIWFVLWVEFWNSFITIIFWGEFSLRRKHKPDVSRFSNIVYNVDEAFIVNYCCLQFFWTHPKTMQCFVVDTTSTFFLRSLISAPSIQK